MMIPACKEHVEPQQHKALIDFDSIVFGIIVISSIILIYFPKRHHMIFRTNFDSFQKFTFDFLNLENSGTNLKNRILATCAPG